MTPEEYGKLTDKEIWLWYVKPEIEKAERMKAAKEGREPAGGAWEPQTEEEVRLALGMLGINVPESK